MTLHLFILKMYYLRYICQELFFLFSCERNEGQETKRGTLVLKHFIFRKNRDGRIMLSTTGTRGHGERKRKRKGGR